MNKTITLLMKVQKSSKNTLTSQATNTKDTGKL